MEESKKYIIGLDLGINNVGWSVLNSDDNEVIECGVVSFKESSDAKDRRGYRASRRIIKRRRHRIERLAVLFKEAGIPTNRIINEKMLDTRINGLNNQITLAEIVNICYYFAVHRGYMPFDDNSNERETIKLNENEYPCQYLKTYHTQNGKYRGTNELIMSSDNIRELRAILTNNMQYYPVITEQMIAIIIKIITDKREFFQGPGLPKPNALSSYGRYRTKDDLNKLQLNPNHNKYLYERLIGKCRIAVGESCAPIYAYEAETFNFFNDFINTRVVNVDLLEEKYRDKVDKNGKFTRDTILDIQNYILKSNSVSLKNIAKEILKTDVENLAGYRIDKNKKPEFSKFEFYRYMLAEFNKNNLSPHWLTDQNKEIYNKVIYILTVIPSSVQIKQMADDLLPNILNADDIVVLSEIKRKKNDKFKYHSLSMKILKRTLDDMKKSDYQYNYMQLMRLNDYEKERREYIENTYSKQTTKPYLMETKYVDEEIINPQVKKTLRKAIKTINAIIDKYKNYPSVIAIESAKEMNSKNKKAEIEKDQARLEKIKKDARKLLEDNGLTINDANIDRAMCYKETNEQCVYCGKHININELNSTDIEHILPISNSFDDSFNNKTCSCKKCNETKGKKTGYQYVAMINNIEDYTSRIKSYNMPEAKKFNLLYKDDITKYEAKFINRNLRDVSYASTALINEINMYNIYLNKINGCHIDTLSTPGQLTTKTRRQMRLDEKDRSTIHHHAIDASIIASIANSETGQIIIKLQNRRDFLMAHKDLLKSLSNRVYNFSLDNIASIRNITPDNIKISYEVSKNPKQSFADANVAKIIKEDDKYYLIQQISDIYSIDLKQEKVKTKLEKLFNDQDNTMQLLCQKDDPRLYELLKAIYNEYKDKSSSPFRDYAIFAGGIEDGATPFNYLKHGIKKSEKKVNSPIVKKLRYKKIISNPYLYIKKKNARSNNNNEFITPLDKSNTFYGLTQIKQCGTEIYYDYEKSKYIFLPISSLSYDLKTRQVNKDEHYYQETYQRLIGDKTLKYIDIIFNGEYVRVEKKTGIIFEGKYKGYDKNNKTLAFYPNGDMRKTCVSMVESDKHIIIYSIDILGKKYIRLDTKKII